MKWVSETISYMTECDVISRQLKDAVAVCPDHLLASCCRKLLFAYEVVLKNVLCSHVTQIERI